MRPLAFPVFLLLLPAVIAFALLVHFASGLPLLDDYHAIFGFGMGWEHLSTTGSRLSYLAAYQHVDYKLIFLELILIIELALTHHVSIWVLLFIGNLFLPAILWLLWKQYARKGEPLKDRLLYFVPIAFLFFALSYAEIVDFAMESLQHLPAVFFSMAALQLLASALDRNGRRHFVLACCAATLACLASANSFLIAPLGAAVLLMRRAYRQASMWCAVFILPVSLYFYHRLSFTHPLKASIWQRAAFFLTVLGGSAPAYKLAIPTGIFILIVFAMTLVTRYDRENLAAVLTATWLLLTVALIAVGRSGYGYEMSLELRYKMYSNLLLIFCYGFAFRRVTMSRLSARRQWLYVPTLVAASLFCIRWDMTSWNFFAERQHKLQLGWDQYSSTGGRVSPLYMEHPENDKGSREEARVLTNNAVATTFYRPPTAVMKHGADMQKKEGDVRSPVH